MIFVIKHEIKGWWCSQGLYGWNLEWLKASLWTWFCKDNGSKEYVAA